MCDWHVFFFINKRIFWLPLIRWQQRNTGNTAIVRMCALLPLSVTVVYLWGSGMWFRGKFWVHAGTVWSSPARRQARGPDTIFCRNSVGLRSAGRRPDTRRIPCQSRRTDPVAYDRTTPSRSSPPRLDYCNSLGTSPCRSSPRGCLPPGVTPAGHRTLRPDLDKYKRPWSIYRVVQTVRPLFDC